MSGHSKWSSIKNKKGALDAKRGQLFTKVIKEITVASKLGGGDESINARLRAAIIKAKAANMPKENVAKAIKKGIGGMDGVDYVELTYEGYGPGGVAIMVNTLTDNKNRTAADVRSLITKSGGSLGTTGCVSYLFSKKGVITIDADKASEEKVFEVALEAGADDITNEDGMIEVKTSPEAFEAVVKAIEAAGIETEMAEVSMVPEITVKMDAENAAKVIRLIDKLEELDDVQTVSSNLDLPDDFEVE